MIAVRIDIDIVDFIFFLDMFNFDEDLLDSEVTGEVEDSTPFPISSSDDEYDSSSAASK